MEGRMYSSMLFTVLILSGIKICVFQPLLNESIFESDYCDLTCNGRRHTMCPLRNPRPECSMFKLHKFQEGDIITDIMQTLVNGHNGVRNRIADRMHVSNMLEMTWDPKLARMAENYLYRCNDNAADPCTLTHVVFEKENTINEFFKFNHSPAYIVQNMFQEKSTFYPYKFIERVIRSWYFEKDAMRAPTVVSASDIDEKKLRGENNFTHFAYPFINRFGCGMARFDNTFHIVCNYYPFFRTGTNSMYFQTGEPASNCPARFPLRDAVFEHLCTDDDGIFSSNEATEVTMDIWNIAIMLCALL